MRRTTTGDTSNRVSATTPMNAKVRRVWNERGTLGRSPERPSRRSGGAVSGGRGADTSALGELVARAAHREDELGQGGIVLDLVAQVAHVDVDRLLVLVQRLVVTEQLEELAAAEDPTRTAREVAQDLELGRR